MIPQRTYEVVALHVPIVYDGYGDHDRNGMMYTLAENEDELRRVRREFPDPFPDPVADPELVPQPHPLVRPLVLRARVGERLKIRFRNELPQRAGIHTQGVGYDLQTADGGHIGGNHDSSVEPGGRREYVWECRREGVFHFSDIADLRGSEDGSNAHGLFGALVVEPAESTWTDPETGEPITDGLYADIHVPGEPSYREYVLMMHDETDNHNPAQLPHMIDHGRRPGRPGEDDEGDGHGGGDGHDAAIEAADEHGETGEAAEIEHSMMLLSYRTEPMGGRALAYRRLLESGQIDPVRDRITGEEQHHSSWLFGDPATPIFRAYRGDRAKIHVLHSGVKETHVFHLHVHQWRAVPGNEESPLIDSVTIGPQQAFTIEPLGGAGSVQQATGDVIFHCHLYPHFHSGMWGMWRVFDVLQDGGGTYPDGTAIAPLRPLPGHDEPPAPTAERPGFPRFMEGEYPQKSPRPPRTPLMPEGMGREPSDLERAAFVDDPQPGEAFTKITTRTDAPVRRYDLVVMTGPVDYYRGSGEDSSTWRDEHGVFYVLQEELDEAGGIEAFQRQLAVGTRKVEPIAIRANKGEVVELGMTNALPPGPQEENDFDPFLPFQPECGLHVHLVKFDPLVSDGSSIGWNYLTGATTADHGEEDFARYNTWMFRWYCDEEFGTIFFHDHLLANERQRHGLFGAMIAEAEGAQWSRPDGSEANNSSQAVVRLSDGTAFREQVLAVADFVPLWQHHDGEEPRPINPPDFPGALDDQGVMGVNYRCEPLHERPGDPADWFDSDVHGDPFTPLTPMYHGETLRIRLYQGSHEEQHSFRVNGMRWPAWWTDPGSPWRDQQTIGISEAFTLNLDAATGPGDHQWSLASIDDTWLGCWGIIRVLPELNGDLPPLPGALFSEPTFTDAQGGRERRYRVEARAGEIHYSPHRSDPFGAYFTTRGLLEGEPLILRCRVGEWVEVELVNRLDGPLEATPFDPPLPALDDPEDREISARVSLHPSGLVQYDVRTGDGSNVGFNEDGTARPGSKAVYRWYAERPGVVLLEDRADVRTHRHRGLVGALIVEEESVTPYDPVSGRERWVGEQAVLKRAGHESVHELVLLLQDGVRQYHQGDPTQPVRDLEDEPEDSGQKAFNYRSAHLRPTEPSLAQANPVTPVVDCSPGEAVRLHLVTAADRPRNHTFYVHGQTWPMEEHLREPHVGAIGGVTTGTVRSLDFTPSAEGDYAYRTGVLRWALSEGLWGLVRVRR
ncbi:multicopper oxidase domain-containing protein [Glycomyces buryatensis]|uniref:Copper oxidase n=1 Tax=Glycomyces buryatensis TaxID=2570927 RepID=A0A4S8QH02_9ACTN|nr:multicopper oxidase domain-containing protein [Glycomyces buryatensis]THV42472.1 hypothetical protein FAB82_06250 [Glycomyces buryatensis]